MMSKSPLTTTITGNPIFRGRCVSRFALLALLSLIAWCSGCQKYQVTVSLDDGLREGGMMPSMEVDVVGVNESELDRWRHYSVTQYFSAEDLFRKDADRYTMTFTDSDAKPKTLEPKDPVWKVWQEKSAQALVILAHLPGEHQDQPDQQDARRLIIPLADSGFSMKQASTITVVVKKSGLVSVSDGQP